MGVYLKKQSQLIIQRHKYYIVSSTSMILITPYSERVAVIIFFSLKSFGGELSSVLLLVRQAI